MQNKNLFPFLVCALLIMVGWAVISNKLWPPKKAAVDETPRLVLPDPMLWAGLPSQAPAAALPAMPGLSGAANLATQLALAEWSGGPLKAPPSPKVEKPAKVARATPPRPKQPHIEDIPLGGPGFNLQVALTTRGAGVEGIVLPEFQEATTEGKPDWEIVNGVRKPVPLAMIPKNPLAPSDLLYAYAASDEAHPANPRAELGTEDWKLVSATNGPNDAEHQVVFRAEVPDQDIVITKTYTLKPDDYHIGLSLAFERKAGGNPKPLPFRYQLAGGHGLPIEGAWYTYTFRNALIGRMDARGNIWRDLQSSEHIGYEGGGNEVMPEDKPIEYAAVATQYFTAATVVDNEQERGVEPGDLIAWARPTLSGEPDPEQPKLDDITVRVTSKAIDVKPGERVVHKYLLYNGPVKVRLLSQLEKGKPVSPALIHRYETTLGLYSLTDYGKFGFWSQIIIFCTNVMHSLLWFLHNYIMPWSYGLCIILLTVIVRGCMFPMSRRQAVSSAKMQAKMAELAPEVKKLEEKYKNDSMGLQQAKNELYLKRGVHPLAMMGSCWMLFLQMPIYLGLFYGLQESIYFRLAPFLYMDNLAAPDMMFRWGNNIPILSHYLGPYFNLLPIIAVILQMMQQQMMTPPPTDEQQAMQQKMMKYMMIMFGFIFYKFAAGLCIYYIASSAWTLAERKLFLPKMGPAVPATAAGPGGGRAAGGPTSGRPRRPSSPPTNGNGGPMQKVKDMWEKVLKEAKKK